MTGIELIIAVAVAMAVAQAIHELVRVSAGGETDAQRQSRMHAVADDQRQAAISEKREAQMLETHWTCPHCMTLVSTVLDSCPACGSRLTLAVLRAQGWKREA